MIQSIYQSTYVKYVALLLVICCTCMSFRMRGNAEVVLPAGTPIPMETMSLIRSDQVIPGQVIDFRVKYDVKVEDQVVIPAGSIAKGQVMRAQKAKGLGKEGFVEIQIKSVQAVDQQEVFLTGGNLYQEGEDKQTLAIVLGIVVCILFLTMKGKNAEVPAGFEFNAHVATNMTIAAK
ncbi:hypothetical protein BWI97_17635 [Siphonobacter sp. BAB-5405]|uniref:hypothetical protein n=1 Tax=Siphonobacter sp. BAB-5405 TaxID=1864825 RepID=UPI000C809062|nr:hypothetical protein [Siphonobacter sp. BAB-5405]PMD93763.1 hypothetical protein BWI97_17635 [Siphonobacter sp. BAB-5405]